MTPKRYFARSRPRIRRYDADDAPEARGDSGERDVQRGETLDGGDRDVGEADLALGDHAGLDPESRADVRNPLLDEIPGVNDDERRLPDALDCAEDDGALPRAAREHRAALDVARERVGRLDLVVAKGVAERVRDARADEAAVLEAKELAALLGGALEDAPRSPREDERAVLVARDEVDVLGNPGRVSTEANPLLELGVPESELDEELVVHVRPPLRLRNAYGAIDERDHRSLLRSRVLGSSRPRGDAKDARLLCPSRTWSRPGSPPARPSTTPYGVRGAYVFNSSQSPSSADRTPPSDSFGSSPSASSSRRAVGKTWPVATSATVAMATT